MRPQGEWWNGHCCQALAPIRGKKSRKGSIKHRAKKLSIHLETDTSYLESTLILIGCSMVTINPEMSAAYQWVCSITGKVQCAFSVTGVTCFILPLSPHETVVSATVQNGSRENWPLTLKCFCRKLLAFLPHVTCISLIKASYLFICNIQGAKSLISPTAKTKKQKKH